jgi:hypothetical protein
MLRATTRPFARVCYGAQDVTEDVRLLTYDEIASAFGITRESARQLVIRKRWSRKKGNDGKARIEVPEEALSAPRTSEATPPVTPTDPSAHTGDDTSDDTSDEACDDPSVATVLTRHIERIERELDHARSLLSVVTTERDRERAERDLERAKAAQVDVLKAVLEAEQRRSTELREERDRWQQIATAPRGLFSWLRQAR